MGRCITDVTSAEFDALFTGFEHTAYRLETLQAYDVSYQEDPYRAFLDGHPQPRDPAKNQRVSMIGDAVRAGKILQRVHVVREPLTDYLRDELGGGYPPNVEAGEDIRILVVQPGSWPNLRITGTLGELTGPSDRHHAVLQAAGCAGCRARMEFIRDSIHTGPSPSPIIIRRVTFRDAITRGPDAYLEASLIGRSLLRIGHGRVSFHSRVS